MNVQKLNEILSSLRIYSVIPVSRTDVSNLVFWVFLCFLLPGVGKFRAKHVVINISNDNKDFCLWLTVLF